MPKVGETTAKKQQPFEYGKDQFECPRCEAVHWYPFKDGCHNPACGFRGTLKLKARVK